MKECKYNNFRVPCVHKARRVDVTIGKENQANAECMFDGVGCDIDNVLAEHERERIAAHEERRPARF